MRREVTWLVLVAVLAGAAAGQSYEELYSQASAMSARGDYRGAIEKFQAALRLRPASPEALSNLGVMYHMAGRYADAVETMNRVLKSAPGLFPARLILGLDLVHLERFPEAVQHLRIATEANPQSQEAQYGLAAAYVGANRLQEAADVYEARTRAAGGEADAWYGLGLCYERMAEQASRALSKAPGGAALNKQFLSEFLVDRGENRLAEEALREATALQQEKPSAAARAAYEEARMLSERSRRAFARLLEAAPEAWQSRLFLGDLNRQQRHFPEAVAHYRAVSKMQPENPAPLLGLGTVHWELGEFDQAEGYLTRVLKLNPKASQALFQLGNIRVRQHRDAEAIPLLAAFLKAQPDSLSAAADLGKAHFHLKQYREALPYLQRARAIDERGDLHFQLATVLKELGRPGESQAALQRSRELRARALEREQRLKAKQ